MSNVDEAVSLIRRAQALADVLCVLNLEQQNGGGHATLRDGSIAETLQTVDELLDQAQSVLQAHEAVRQ